MADQFDDIRRMNEAMEQLGDEPPEITVDATPEQVAEVETPTEPAQVAAPEDLSGGLSEVLGDEQDRPLTVDDILGLNKPVESAPAEPKDTGESASPVEESPSGVDKRFAELTSELARLREQNDLLVNQRLKEGSEPVAEPVGDETELNPDVQDYMKPYIKDALGFDPEKLVAENERLRKVTEPLIAQRETEELAGAISRHVEGFDSSHMPELQKAFDGLSEQEQAEYGGIQGAALFAQSLVSRGALNVGTKQKQTPRTLSRRMHGETSGAAPIMAGEMSEDDKIKRLNELSGESIRQMVDGLGG